MAAKLAFLFLNLLNIKYKNYFKQINKDMFSILSAYNCIWFKVILITLANIKLLPVPFENSKWLPN